MSACPDTRDRHLEREAQRCYEKNESDPTEVQDHGPVLYGNRFGRRKRSGRRHASRPSGTVATTLPRKLRPLRKL